MSDDDVMIGLEVHVQLNKLKSKMFCRCSTKYHDAAPNTHTCPVCLGLPGSLPVMNKQAVENGVMVGLALGCTIEQHPLFYRKNYYYPDLPKGFQITQYDFPLATNGTITIETEQGEHTIRIRRVHMEEDPGRLAYKGTIDRAKYSLADYNRSGMPLLEVVTEPDLRSPKEARTFLNKLRNILEYLDVSDGNLDGAMRVDSNISLRGGHRAEVKNISSYKGVERALLFEILRQKNLLRRGGTVVQETRHFDDVRLITVSLRTKEMEEDYRYFPEPDLVPFDIRDWVDDIKQTLPELPDAKRTRFVEQYGISDYHAKVLTSELALAYFYEKVAAEVNPVLSATWIADVLKGELNYRDDHYVLLRAIARSPDEYGLSGLQDVQILPDIGLSFRPDILAKNEQGDIVFVEVEIEPPDEDALDQISRHMGMITTKFENTETMIIAPILYGLLIPDEVVEKMNELIDSGAILINLSDKPVPSEKYTIESIKPKHMIELLQHLERSEITDKAATEVIRTLLDEGGTPQEIVKGRGLMKVDTSEVDTILQEVIDENPTPVADYQNGKEEALNYLVGQVMKKTRGRADPGEVNQLLRNKLDTVAD